MPSNFYAMTHRRQAAVTHDITRGKEEEKVPRWSEGESGQMVAAT